MSRSQVVEQMLAERRAAAEPRSAEDPSSRQIRADLEAKTEALRQQSRAISDTYDQALIELERTRADNELVPRNVREVTENMSAADRAAFTRSAHERAAAKADRAAEAAREQLKAARAQVLAELLPDPPRAADRDRVEREIGEELELHPDLERGLRAVVEQYLARGDMYAVQVMLGAWGRRRYQRAGGSADTWAALHRDLLGRVAAKAEPQLRRRYEFLIGNAPDSLLTILHHQARRAVEP